MSSVYTKEFPFMKSNDSIDVIKNVNEDERLFTAVVLRPDVVDAHGDIYSKDVVKQAAHDFARFLGVCGANLQHAVDVDKAEMEFVESFIAPVDMNYAQGMVKQGDWVLTAKIHNDDIWKMCKEGLFTGFSVGCSALVESVE